MSIGSAELKRLYEEMSNKELCKKLGVSNPTLIGMLKRGGIELKGKGNRTEKAKIKVVD